MSTPSFHAQVARAEELASSGSERAALKILKSLVWRAGSSTEAELLLAGIGRVFEKCQTRQRKPLERTQEAANTRLRDLQRQEGYNQQQASARLLCARLGAVLKLLFHNPGAVEVARAEPIFASMDMADHAVSDAIDRTAANGHVAWGAELTDGYARGRRAGTSLNLSPLADHRRKMEQTLKTAAVELLTHGAEVSGLSEDAIPLVAYALSAGVLPASVMSAGDDLQEEVNDSVLSQADRGSQMSAEQRPVFFACYRLAFLLGVAQEFAERLSITKLTIT